MTAMRVYLGSDHAGFELKQALIDHLRKSGHEPIDCGAYVYDAEDDYPAFCIAAAAKTLADPESLGIVIGGSGNGEQIAANKVPGVRCALAWSVETATLARQHNNAQVMGIGGRMHTVEQALEIVDAFLGAEWSKAERHQRRIDILAEYEKTHIAPPVPGAPGVGMPEGHTLHRLARLHQRRFGRAPVMVSSPQGRFVDGAAAVNGRVLKKATAWGKHLFHHYDGGRVVHVHLGLYGTFTEVPTPMPLPVGQVRMRMIGTEYGTDLRGPTVCEVIEEPEVADVVARLGPDPLRRDADGSLAWVRIRKSRRPIGALLMDQTVIAGVGNVYRNELLYRHRIDPYRTGIHIGEAEFDAMWTDLVELMKVGFRRGKIIVVRPEDDHGLPSYGPGRARAPTCTAGQANRAACAAPRSAPRSWKGATCFGARPARSRVRARQSAGGTDPRRRRRHRGDRHRASPWAGTGTCPRCRRVRGVVRARIRRRRTGIRSAAVGGAAAVALLCGA